jgi:hypothetical protein
MLRDCHHLCGMIRVAVAMSRDGREVPTGKTYSGTGMGTKFGTRDQTRGTSWACTMT